MKRTRILVVDDEPGMLEACRDTLRRIQGAEIETAADGAAAAKLLSSGSYDLVLSDMRMPEMSGTELLRFLRQIQFEAPVLVMTAFPEVESAVECMRLGAVDYVTKPFIPDELLLTVKRVLETGWLREENRVLIRQVEKPYHFDDMLGNSREMRELFDQVARAAEAVVDTLILGETGTGKELLARSLHRRGRRASGRFVPVDCGAIPSDLIESELFGHERGAFTGASTRSPALFEVADGGTVFLDEVGELPLALQSRLLRSLQERAIRRVGGRDEIPVDVQVVAATNRDLKQEVQAGRFREDLYYRLDVMTLRVPPLRQRGDDIFLLCEHFVERFAAEANRPIGGIEPDAAEILRAYQWPGNVRELQNAMRRAVILCDGRTISVDDLRKDIVLDARPAPPLRGYARLRQEKLDEFEREYLVSLLERHGGVAKFAIEEAQLPRGTFYRLLKRHGINIQGFRGTEEAPT